MRSVRRLLAIIALTLPLVVNGQPGGDNPGDDPDNPVPLTGIEWLLLAGGLLGAKKLFRGFRSRS